MSPRHITSHYIIYKYITLHNATLRYIKSAYDNNSHRFTSRQVMSHLVTSRHKHLFYITLRHVIPSHHIKSRHIALHCTAPLCRYRIASHIITSRHVTSYRITLHNITSHGIISHHTPQHTTLYHLKYVTSISVMEFQYCRSRQHTSALECRSIGVSRHPGRNQYAFHWKSTMPEIYKKEQEVASSQWTILRASFGSALIKWAEDIHKKFKEQCHVFWVTNFWLFLNRGKSQNNDLLEQNDTKIVIKNKNKQG